MELESGYGETEVQPRVQDRGGEAGDRAGRDGGPGVPGSELAESVLRRWMREATVAPATAFPGNGQQRAELAEIATLKKEVAKLKAERDILKKAAAYFAREAT
jgi:hypothetical protein